MLLLLIKGYLILKTTKVKALCEPQTIFSCFHFMYDTQLYFYN